MYQASPRGGGGGGGGGLGTRLLLASFPSPSDGKLGWTQKWDVSAEPNYNTHVTIVPLVLLLTENHNNKLLTQHAILTAVNSLVIVALTNMQLCWIPFTSSYCYENPTLWSAQRVVPLLPLRVASSLVWELCVCVCVCVCVWCVCVCVCAHMSLSACVQEYVCVVLTLW